MTTKRFLSALVIFCLSCLYGFSQDYSPKLGPHSNKNKFKYNAEDTKRLHLRRHVPKTDSVIAYNKEGKKFELKITDTVRVADIYESSWDGKKGKWILFYDTQREGSDSYDYYVLLNDMSDIEGQAQVIDEVNFENVKQEGKKLWVIIIFNTAIILGLFITIFIFFRRFFSKVVQAFYKLIDTKWPSIIAFCFVPFLYFYFFIYRHSNIQLIFDSYGSLQITDSSEFANTALFFTTYRLLATLSIYLGCITFIWSSFGMFIAGFIKFLTILGASKVATTYDGGATYYISWSSGSSIEINYGLIIRLWLVYSLVLPFIYFLINTITPSEKTIRQISLTILITGGFTIFYLFVLSKKTNFLRKIFSVINPILGFLLTNLLLFISLIILRLLIIFFTP